MFKKMMKYKKTWQLFCQWLLKKYNFEFRENEFLIFNGEKGISRGGIYLEARQEYLILSIMPYFFKEQKVNFKYVIDLFDYDLECLKLSCEKAFDILEKEK